MTFLFEILSKKIHSKLTVYLLTSFMYIYLIYIIIYIYKRMYVTRAHELELSGGVYAQECIIYKLYFI